RWRVIRDKAVSTMQLTSAASRLDDASKEIGRLVPLCRIDLNHARVVQHGGLAIRGEADKPVLSIGADGEAIEFGDLVPGSIHNRQSINSTLCCPRLCDGHRNVYRFAVVRPGRDTPGGFEFP